MARVTVEDCLRTESNRFALVLLAAQRARQLAGGAKPLVASDNNVGVTALREIAAGEVHFVENVKAVLMTFIGEGRVRLAQQRATRSTAPRGRLLKKPAT